MTSDPANRPVRPANEFCRNVARVREGLRRVLVYGARPVTRAEQCAPTLRPQAVNAQVGGASSDNGSDVELRAEWAQLAAAWGIGGWVNQADELLKRDPAAAPPGAIEAGWRLLDLLEWIDLPSTDPRSFETWRSEP
jgi:hypothetical protein